MKMRPLTAPFIEMPDGKLVYRTELIAAYERIEELEASLEEALEYFKDNYDVVDGDNGEQRPNKEMRLGLMIDETLHGPGNF